MPPSPGELPSVGVEVNKLKGVTVGVGVAVGRGVEVTVGGKVGSGVQVGGSTSRGVGVRVGIEIATGSVGGGNGLIPAYGLKKIIKKMIATTTVANNARTVSTLNIKPEDLPAGWFTSEYS